MAKNLKDYNYIGFDLDGTIMNTYEGVAGGIKYVMRHFGRPEPTEQEIRLCIGPPLDDSFRNLFGFTAEESKLGIDKFREYYAPIGQNLCRPYEGIAEALKSLSESGKKIFVATSKLITPAVAILENFDLAKYFCLIEGTPVGCGDCSKADILRSAIGKLGNPDLDDVILIGDTKFDIIGAKEVGIASMGVLYGFGSREDFETHGADFIVATPEEITKSFI